MRTFLKKYKVHLFPIAVVLLSLVLSLLKISGSSIGSFFIYLHGDSIRDPNLVLNVPRGVRSDEWLVNTQLTFAQDSADYPRFNQNINGGEDMSIALDVPYRDWSTAFKPQNLGFLVMPLDYAFALKWWFLISVPIIASYYFFLGVFRKMHRPVLLAIIFSFVISASPFMLWWYQSTTLLTVGYGFVMLLLAARIIDDKQILNLNRTWSRVIHVGALAYVATCFALLMYPPFQIPVLLIVAFYALGKLVAERRGKKSLRTWLTRPLLLFGASAILAGVGTIGFVLDAKSAIDIVSGTVYPGRRTVVSGSYDPSASFVTYLQPQLQKASSAQNYYTNQSEASNFIVSSVVVTIPALLVAIAFYREKRRVPWVLVALITCSVVFLLHLFIPLATPVMKLFFLHLVPVARLLIGLGMLGILLVAYSIKVGTQLSERPRWLTPGLILYFVFVAIYALWRGIGISSEYPKFISNVFLIAGLCGLLYLTLWALFTKRFLMIGAASLLVFVAASGFHIMPLYREAAAITHSDIVSSIQELSSKDDTWGVLDSIHLENVPQVAGRKALTGTLAYPNIQRIRSLYPTEDSVLYNRYANVILSSTGRENISLKQNDFYTLSADECEDAATKVVTRILSTSPVSLPCYQEIRQLHYPTVTIYLYKRV